MTLIDKYKVSEENRKVPMKLKTGGTHAVSRTQDKIMKYDPMNYII